MFERDYRTLSFVPRWSIVRTIKQQYVDGHSYFVSLYTIFLTEILEWDAQGSLSAVKYSLKHDRDESFTGDVPHPVKSYGIEPVKFNGWIKEESDHRFKDDPYTNDKIKSVVRVADLLDSVLYLISEEVLGNREVIMVKDSCMQQLNLAIDKLPCVEIKREEVRRAINAAIHDELTGRSGFPGIDDEKLVNDRDTHL